VQCSTSWLSLLTPPSVLSQRACFFCNDLSVMPAWSGEREGERAACPLPMEVGGRACASYAELTFDCAMCTRCASDTKRIWEKPVRAARCKINTGVWCWWCRTWLTCERRLCGVPVPERLRGAAHGTAARTSRSACCRRPRGRPCGHLDRRLEPCHSCRLMRRNLCTLIVLGFLLRRSDKSLSALHPVSAQKPDAENARIFR
jgi:hypothetical protein